MSSVSAPGPAAKSRRSSGPSKADLKNQLASALAVVANLQARCELAESQLLAKPATATPPPGSPCGEALMPEAEGVIRVWLMTHDEGYRLQLIHLGADGAGWRLTKWSDGTQYDLFQADGPDIQCDCPGGQAHGPRCCNGQGCKHARFLRALRKLVSPAV